MARLFLTKSITLPVIINLTKTNIMFNQLKNLKYVCFVLAIVTFGSCADDTKDVQVMDQNAANKILSNSFDEADLLKIENEYSVEERIDLAKTLQLSVETRGPISYDGRLCGDQSVSGDAVTRAWPNGDFDAMDYWSFYAEAGASVTVALARINCEMDPILYVFEGTAETSEGVNALPIVGAADDNTSPTCVSCFAYSDATVSFIAPSTGFYTARVADYISCSSGPHEYTLTLSGLGTAGEDCDGDGEADLCDDDDDNDGVADEVDNHPCSNDDATVIIDDCDSGVANQQLANGSNMNDLIGDCASEATNHGEFVSCVAELTNQWKADGLISGREKGAIQRCAAQSDIPE